MAVRERYSEGLSIVVVGSFNPAIFHPAWFVAEGLLPSLDSHDVELDVVHNQLTRFSADWLELQVDPMRLQVSTSESSAFDPLRDLALGALRLLRHTPVRRLGINTTIHLRFGDGGERTRLLERYAPTRSWSGVLEGAVLDNLSVQGSRSDGYVGSLSVRLEPSARVEPGVFIALNDHYELDDERHERPHGADLAIDVLTKGWDDARQRAQQIVDGVTGS